MTARDFYAARDIALGDSGGGGRGAKCSPAGTGNKATKDAACRATQERSAGDMEEEVSLSFIGGEVRKVRNERRREATGGGKRQEERSDDTLEVGARDVQRLHFLW